MSSKTGQAQQYAQAILAATVERWQTILTDSSDALAGDQGLADLLAGNGNLEEKASALTNAISATPSTEEANLLKMLIQAGETEILADIAVALTEAASGQSGPQTAEIVSAVELTETEQSAIQQKLVAEYGDNLTFDFSVDESLMGGLRVRVGDRLTDMSISSRLTALREQMASAVH
ncbi:ATP synthase F1 subunit delta [Chloroflexi bacterium TSY]|nr:ATP synthase F1 subunit delta [Chloroflexi bacterium TSY]